MAYYKANEPYNKQDGLGNGFMLGAAMGGAGYYGTKVGTAIGQTKHFSNEQAIDLQRKNIALAESNAGRGIKGAMSNYKDGQNIGQQAMADANPKYADSKRFKAFGRGRNRAVTAGASVLAGGLLGAGIDSMN